MRFPLTQQLLDEARAFSLRAACRDCFFWSERRGECWHGWPDEGQRRWPLAAGADLREGGAELDERGGETQVGGDVAFCKEFELR